MIKNERTTADRTDHGLEQDRDRIDVSEEHECRYWTEKLGITYQALKRIVGEVGPLVKDVRRHLAR
jgi:Protein of unknown function (DUF3606)